MKNFFRTIIMCFVILFSLFSNAFACTTIIVGKNASADGSAFFGRTDDASELSPNGIKSFPASNEEGTYVYEDEHTGLKLELDKKCYKYFMSPRFEESKVGEWGEVAGNEFGVCMSGTETLVANEEALKYDPYVKNGLAESNMVRLIIPYVKTAREAVIRLGEYIDKYGSAESNGVIFGDSEEVWYMEIYTGHTYAAVKCPDDKYAVIANDAMLGTIDFDDIDNVICSKNIVSYPKEHGFIKNVDGKMHLAMTYNRELNDYSQIRVWAGRKWFSNDKQEYDVNKRYDIFETPNKKISLSEVFDFTRYRFEDTKYTLENPNNNIRPIGIERMSNCGIFQLRKNKSPIAWICLANADLSIYMPMYFNIDMLPQEFVKEECEYDKDVAYWKFRSVSALANTNRSKYGKIVQEEYKKLENKFIKQISEMDAEYEKGYKLGSIASKIFEQKSKQALDLADQLFDKLVMQISLDDIEKSKKYGKDK